jgi:GGDEF-like domain/PucR C-terminal helix-turn-helix domain
MGVGSDDSRSRLLEGVRSRRQEIGRAVFDRVHAIGPGGAADLEYRDGLRQATEAAIDHTIEALEGRSQLDLSVPVSLLSQARLAARRRVPLEVILRRYLAGNAVLGDFVMEEAERQDVSAGILRWILRSQAVTADRAVAVIGATYLQEADSTRPRSSDDRRAELVRRFLAGELIDPASLEYAFDRWHLALAVRGQDRVDAADAVTATLDVRRLIVPADDDSLWVWLGTREKLEPRCIEEAVAADLPTDIRVGIGEPAVGRAGWRLSHEQAQAALTVAIRSSGTAARYADVALLASAMQDDLIATSLHQIYLVPLDEDHERGGVLRETLCAYLATRGNVTSAAAILSVDRRTVANRLRVAENRIGTSLDVCVSELKIALQLDRLDRRNPA